MKNLKGKKILMFSPHGVTLHYCDTIIRELRSRGAFVADYDERPSQNAVSKTIIRYCRSLFPQYYRNYIEKVIRKNKSYEFDYVLVIKGEAFTPDIVQLLRKAYPKATFILYMWDLLSVRKIDDIIPLFDRTLTFDWEDSKKADKLIFRPTFYADAYEKLKAPFHSNCTDVLFIGTLHTDRYEVLKRIETSFHKVGVSSTFFYYVPAIVVYLRNKFLKKKYAPLRLVRFTPYSVDETMGLMEGSKAILDLSYNTMHNVSMRAFESLVTKRKYITNNTEIKRYDFYDPQNIMIISKDTPVISKDFFCTPFKEIPQEIINRYNVSQWIDDVFFNTQQNFFR